MGLFLPFDGFADSSLLFWFRCPAGNVGSRSEAEVSCSAAAIGEPLACAGSRSAPPVAEFRAVATWHLSSCQLARSRVAGRCDGDHQVRDDRSIDRHWHSTRILGTTRVFRHGIGECSGRAGATVHPSAFGGQRFVALCLAAKSRAVFIPQSMQSAMLRVLDTAHT